MITRVNIILLLSCICFNLSYAQLSVRNNAYVFINDQIVFVNNDINLSEANSRIYLRAEAQVIQGSGITGNSGLGELSVYQEGNVNEYAFNYWCSPVGSKTNNSINNPFGISLLNDATGLITFSPATSIHNSNYNGTSSPLNIEPYWIYKYIAGSVYSDWIYVGSATAINAGEGFSMKGTNSGAQRYDFRGKPNSGTIAVNVLANQFTLVGNPYPSALDALKYIHDSENAAVISGTLYFWEQDPTVNSHYLADYQGGYATYTIDSAGSLETSVAAPFNTYNSDGSINVVGSARTLGNKPKRYISIGQGFMIEGTATGTVKAKNSHRVYIKETDPNSVFFKTSNTKEKSTASKTDDGFSTVPSDYNRFRLNIDFNNTYTRQLVETFHDSATDGFDYGLETKINDNDILSSDAYWPNNNESYIAIAQAFDLDLKMPLTVIAAQDLPLRIRIVDVQNFDSSQPIYIHDIENDIYLDLRNQDFDINLETGNYTNRFEVTFSKNTLNVEANEFNGIKVFQNNNLSELTINNPNSLNIKAFKLFDITGKLVLHKEISSIKNKHTYSTKSLSDGVYIANINSENNQVFSKKIIITNKK